MTHHARMLATIRGEPTDRIPWAPRMDLWCIAHRARGTLPGWAMNRNTVELARSLGVACHAVRADYTLPRNPGDLKLRALGLDNHPDYPYRVELRGLPCDFSHDAETLRTVIRTSRGEVVTQTRHTAQMKRDGITIPFVESYAIRSAADLEAVGEVFEHIEVVPSPDAYASFHRRMGDQGLAIASGPTAASPMHFILHELAHQEQFFYLYADERDAIERLARRMEPVFERILDALVQCDAEVVFWGANYDQDLTWPAFFRAQIQPWLQRVAERCHAAGKLLLTHTDGENQKLLPLYPACDFDVAESVCPKPMTRCTVAEVRAGMGPRVTVFGGIPSVALLPDSMDATAFEAHLDGLFAQIGTGERLILGVSDNVPPDAAMDRLERIRERIERFGPVVPAAEAHRKDVKPTAR